MDNTYNYVQQSYIKEPALAEVSPNKRVIIWYDPFFEAFKKHEEIPAFSFAPLDEIKKDYLEAGYSNNEVESMIAGLSELPEYANNRTNKKAEKKIKKLGL